MRLPTRLQREIARLHFHDPAKSHRALADSMGLSPNTVASLRKRLQESGQNWDALRILDDPAWQEALGTHNRSVAQTKPHPNWADIHDNMSRPDATLTVLWQEWRETVPSGIGYSAFTDGYRDWLRDRHIAMRRVHRPGEKLFVDFAGKTITIHYRDGRTVEAQIFVAVLGYSNWTFIWAVESQSIAAFVECHVKCFERLGGVPQWVVPDNLKSAVIRRTRDRIELNPIYRACLAHYNTAALPARPRRPKDKAKAEVGVQIAQRWVLFRLRDRMFFDITELNAELALLTDQLNRHPFRKLDGSRQDRFEQTERATLADLPPTRYEVDDWRYSVLVGRDHHVEHRGSHYSVPCDAAGQRVDLRFTANMLEIFRAGRRIALHTLAATRGQVTTLAEHRPVAHQRVLDGEPMALADWSRRALPSTRMMMLHHLEERSDLTNGLKTAKRLRQLAEVHGLERFEEVCKYALDLNIIALRSIESILKHSPDKRTSAAVPRASHAHHDNIRGASYFGGGQ